MALLDNFVEKLHDKIVKRSDLVYFVANTLSIEKESASRRLSNKIPFTVHEMEILSIKLDISLDMLLYSKEKCTIPFLQLNSKIQTGSMKSFVRTMEIAVSRLESISEKPREGVSVFTTLPLEFTFDYSYLNRFIFYKWGYFYVGDKEYNSFTTWKMPTGLKEVNMKLMMYIGRYPKLLYIWSPLTILSIIKDIRFFRSMNAMNNHDIGEIKFELHSMLDTLENIANGHKVESDEIREKEFYISSIEHNIDFYYYSSENNFCTFSNNYFISSDDYHSSDSGEIINNWIKALKKISTLISESGAKERRLFFEEQHKYVEML